MGYTYGRSCLLGSSWAWPRGALARDWSRASEVRVLNPLRQRVLLLPFLQLTLFEHAICFLLGADKDMSQC